MDGVLAMARLRAWRPPAAPTQLLLLVLYAMISCCVRGGGKRDRIGLDCVVFEGKGREGSLRGRREREERRGGGGGEREKRERGEGGHFDAPPKFTPFPFSSRRPIAPYYLEHFITHATDRSRLATRD